MSGDTVRRHNQRGDRRQPAARSADSSRPPHGDADPVRSADLHGDEGQSAPPPPLPAYRATACAYVPDVGDDGAITLRPARGVASALARLATARASRDRAAARAALTELIEAAQHHGIIGFSQGARCRVPTVAKDIRR